MILWPAEKHVGLSRVPRRLLRGAQAIGPEISISIARFGSMKQLYGQTEATGVYHAQRTAKCRSDAGCVTARRWKLRSCEKWPKVLPQPRAFSSSYYKNPESTARLPRIDGLGRGPVTLALSRKARAIWRYDRPRPRMWAKWPMGSLFAPKYCGKTSSSSFANGSWRPWFSGTGARPGTAFINID